MKLETNNVDKTAKKWGNKLEDSAKQYLQRNRATGTLIANLRTKFQKKATETTVKLQYPKYGDILDKGFSGTLATVAGTPYKATRGLKTSSGNRVAVTKERIGKWALSKGIPKKAVYPITRKLLAYGRPGTKWLSMAKAKTNIGFSTEIANSFKIDVEHHMKKYNTYFK